MTTVQGDEPCDDCGGPNVVWFTDDVLWNQVVRRAAGHDLILCVPCFVARVEAAGWRPSGWRVLPSWPWAGEPHRAGP